MSNEELKDFSTNDLWNFLEEGREGTFLLEVIFELKKRYEHAEIEYVVQGLVLDDAEDFWSDWIVCNKLEDAKSCLNDLKVEYTDIEFRLIKQEVREEVIEVE